MDERTDVARKEYTEKYNNVLQRKSSLCTDSVYQAVTHEKKTSDHDIKQRNSK